jgi:hypothetical protein
VKWPLLAVAVLAGLTIFGVGFRLTDEVTVVVGVLGLTAAALGFGRPTEWWLTAVGLGAGVGLQSLYPPPAYRPDARHLALYPPPQPLPLPLGLTGNHVATTVAAALILMSFLLVATGMGCIARRATRQ